MLQERDLLIKMLCFVYRTMLASAPLLRFAIERADGELKTYLEKHLTEEDGHDTMLLDDLKRLGVTDIPHSFLAAQVAGSQYYLIAHEHPAMLLGYMHACERESLPVEYVDHLSGIHGTPLTCMRHHAEHDPHHGKDLAEQIAKLPEAIRSRVYQNEQNVLELLGRVT